MVRESVEDVEPAVEDNILLDCHALSGAADAT
jgi:hypothetical protein